jgi:HEAT repeat protein
VDALLRQLAVEKDADVVASILAQLRNLPVDRPEVAAAAAPLLRHGSPAVRFHAAQLLGDCPAPDVERLAALAESDPAPEVRVACLAAVRDHAGTLTFGRLARVRAADDVRLRALAWAASCRAADTQSAGPALARALVDGAVAVRAAIAQHADGLAPETRRQLWQGLAGDPHASVRGTAAETMGRLGEPDLLGHVLALARDPDAEVRRLAVRALSRFPLAASAEAVVAAFGDGAAYVREEAEESAVRLQADFPLDRQVAARLGDADPEVRFHSYNVLGRLGLADYGAQIAAALPREKTPRLSAAALRALARLQFAGAPDLLLGYARHDAAEVRAAAALTLGNISSDPAREAVKTLIADDDQDVRYNALLAAGRLAHPTFSPLMLHVLKSTGMNTIYYSTHRGAACWAAGRIRPVDPGVAQRLVTQATKPVIPAMGFMMFEPDYVLASACWALARCARDDETVRGLAEQVIAAHAVKPTPEDLRRAGPNALVPSAELQESARQARAYLEDRSVNPEPRPTRTIHMSYRRVD